MLDWVFGGTTVIGTVLTIYYGKKAARLERDRKKLEWQDLQAASNDLGGRLRNKFQPNVVFTPGLRGATFVNLLLNELKPEVPALVGVTSWKESPTAVSQLGGFDVIETNKWYVHIPQTLIPASFQNVLVVDDFAMSGDGLNAIVKMLRQRGFAADSIRTMCIATTRVAVQNHKAPDEYWQIVSDDTFYFPWGKAR